MGAKGRRRAATRLTKRRAARPGTVNPVFAHVQRGDDHVRSKLTDRKVLAMRAHLREQGTINCAHFARKFGVSEQCIWFALHPEHPQGTWRHLPS